MSMRAYVYIVTRTLFSLGAAADVGHPMGKKPAIRREQRAHTSDRPAFVAIYIGVASVCVAVDDGDAKRRTDSTRTLTQKKCHHLCTDNQRHWGGEQRNY